MKLSVPNPLKPTPAPPGFGENRVIAEVSASFLSRVWFSWLNRFLSVGFSRPLEKEDFWHLPGTQLTSSVTDKAEANFYSGRQVSFGKSVPKTDDVEFEKGTREYPPPPPPGESKSTNETSGKDASLLKAICLTFQKEICVSGILKLGADTLRTTTPLLNKVLLNWLVASFVFFGSSEDERRAQGLSVPRGIGYGIGLSFALFVMQEVASLMDNHSMKVSMELGMSIRSAVIGNVFRKSLRLSGKGRAEHSVGQITTHISTDVSKLELSCTTIHNLWVSPIQIAIGTGLLIANLGVSALVGFGVLVLGFPLQTVIARIMMVQFGKSIEITDKRVFLMTEVLQGIRLIKYYAWEGFYSTKIGNLRKMELARLRRVIFLVSSMVSSVAFIPLLGAVLSFVTYSLTGHDLNVSTVFTALQLFNTVKAPLLQLPFAVTDIADAIVALRRITKFLLADELEEPYKIDLSHHSAVDVNGSFSWDMPVETEEQKANKNESSEKGEKAIEQSGADDKELVTSDVRPVPAEATEDPFKLKDVKLTVPKGSFVAIVGRVGSGKSSLLQAILGEMRRESGEVILGGSVAYVPQTPWIQNATLRNNILFGKKEDRERLSEVIGACSLEQDLKILPRGENTEIGEKGINLSGGQKSRVSLARAAYSTADIIILDDPLSAVDAHVGNAILENCLLSGPLSNRTRIMVTHSLHVLDKVDHIYVMDKGEIAEHGSYESLLSNQGLLSKLMDEYGNKDSSLLDNARQVDVDGSKSKEVTVHVDSGSPNDLMQVEDREFGAVSWKVYSKYLGLAGGLITVLLVLLLLIINQGLQVATILWLGFWTAQDIQGFAQGDYIAVYSGLGAAQAIVSYFLIFTFGFVGLTASFKLFQGALSGVLGSPFSFFDTTPMGRILSRLSKDVQAVDNEISLGMYQMLSTFCNVFGTIALIFYTFPLLGVIFAPLTALYVIFSTYYRRTSIETKRLDSVLRSGLYAAYSEALTGLSTIRAYGLKQAFITATDERLDMENRAYYMTITIQRWLAVRLDLFGNILILGIGLFAAGFRRTVDPFKIGVVLSYALSITQVFSEMVTQFAQTEQNMNAVERLLYYAQLPREGNVQEKDPPADWPPNGGIVFSNVKLAYRENLPLALKGVALSIRPREKIGIVGRTGAGKSSLVHALLRSVELTEGTVEIDDLDIKTIDLSILRRRLGLVPQDSILFNGTLRHNIDPEGLRTDAELIEILQKAHLLPSDGKNNAAAEAKFSLDSEVKDEGSNFSVGEKQLLALCRCLVKNSKIIILDEATSSMDAETDAKIQETIRTEFSSSTLICIAHRLYTIAYYDRVVVMKDGKVAEIDTVLNLFDKEESIFRKLCDEAHLRRLDIEKLRAEKC